MDEHQTRELRAAAVAMLARRDHASGELAGRLIDKGFPPEAVAAHVEELLSRKLLDDARFAGNYVTYHSGRGRGPLRIRQDLKGLGLPESLIGTALEAGDFHALAVQVRRRKFGAQVPSAFRDKAKQARFLQYRGFSTDHIRTALGDRSGEPFDPDL